MGRVGHKRGWRVLGLVVLLTETVGPKNFSMYEWRVENKGTLLCDKKKDNDNGASCQRNKLFRVS